MIKILFFLTAFLYSFSSISQIKFIAYEREIKLENDVIEFSDTSSKELYQLSKIWISEAYDKPKKVIINDIENKYIKIHSLAKVPTTGVFNNTNTLFLKYTLLLEFKDDKVKINITDVDGSHNTNYAFYFKKDGTRKESSETIKYLTDIEKYFNELINSLTIKFKNNSDW